MSTRLPPGQYETEVICDIHCVTAWSKFGVTFEGVPARAVLDLGRRKPSARFVMATDRRGFWERNGYDNHADPWKEERHSETGRMNQVDDTDREAR